MATIDLTGKFGSKKSIKSRFEYDLDQILDGCRSNRISLHASSRFTSISKRWTVMTMTSSNHFEYAFQKLPFVAEQHLVMKQSLRIGALFTWEIIYYSINCRSSQGQLAQSMPAIRVQIHMNISLHPWHKKGATLIFLNELFNYKKTGLVESGSYTLLAKLNGNIALHIGSMTHALRGWMHYKGNTNVLCNSTKNDSRNLGQHLATDSRTGGRPVQCNISIKAKKRRELIQVRPPIHRG